MDSAAAIENDETMIINSDHSIITTPVGTPMTDVTVVDSQSSATQDECKQMHLLQVESDETPTSDASSELPVIGEKGKRHRTKARSDSTRSEKYEITNQKNVSALSFFLCLVSFRMKIFLRLPFVVRALKLECV